MQVPYPPHRKQCKRYDNPGDAHYLTFSCLHQQAFLKGQHAPVWLAEALGRARTRYPFDLWAYVFMPDHVHLLIWPAEGTSISTILKAIKEPVAKRSLCWVRKHRPDFLARMEDRQPNGKCSHRFWQRGGGYDRNLWTPQEIWEKVSYIHNNPVRRGLVERPEEWLWSSWRAWNEGVAEPIPIDLESVPPLR
jgi:putative transposase